MKKSIAAVVTLASLAAIGLGASQVHAASLRKLSVNPSQVTWNDLLVFGGGQLRATLTLNAIGAGNDIIIATSGRFRHNLVTTCADGSTQNKTSYGSDALTADILHMCPFFVAATAADGMIDDI